MVKKIKVYISGRISGIDYDFAARQFEVAQGQLSMIDCFEVINPINNGLTRNHTWEQHMVRNIEMLMQCEEIFMLYGWEESKGACIERYIAEKMGIKINYLQ